MNKFMKVFKERPGNINESYLLHMIIALDIAMKLFRTSIKAFVHALVPYFYVHSASTDIESLFNFTKSRRAKTLGKPNIIKDKRFIRETL